jgi:hypothetical protein
MGRYFQRADYSKLDGRQKEVFNFHCVAALLAKCGFATYPIRDDWNGGDMFARHMTDSRKTMVVQLKSRMTFDKKYLGKDIWIGFPDGDGAYVFPHDEFLAAYREARATRGKPLDSNDAWTSGGKVSWKSPTGELRVMLEPYRLDP